MISSTFLLIVGSIFQIVAAALDKIEAVLPTEITTSLELLVKYIYYLKEWFPVGDALAAALLVVSVSSGKYLVEFTLWVLKFVPFLHPPDNTPGIGRSGKGW